MERFAERFSFNDEALCVGSKKAAGTFHSVQEDTFSTGGGEASAGEKNTSAESTARPSSRTHRCACPAPARPTLCPTSLPL